MSGFHVLGAARQGNKSACLSYCVTAHPLVAMCVQFVYLWLYVKCTLCVCRQLTCDP